MISRPLVLASSSRYRQALLSRLQLPFTALSPAVDETPLAGERADALACRLAVQKAAALRRQCPDHLLIGSDQTATVDGHLVGKPGSREAAMAQLAAAAGRCVVFQTAVCVFDSASGQHLFRLVPTTVEFRPLAPAQIAAYVDMEPAYDCAGAFKAEALGIALCSRITSDDPTALIGLPLIALIDLLERFFIAPLRS